MKNKKKVLALALAVCLIATISFGTLAWFSDSDDVTNNFYIASSDDTDPDDIFSVDVWEKVDTDGDGEADTVKPGQDADGGVAEFENVLPGAKYVKNPVVENTGAYDQYIRVVVTLSDAQAWIDALGNGYDLSKIFLGHDETLWSRDVGTRVEDEIIYVYYLNKVLKPGEENAVTLFTHVKLPETLTQQQMAELDGSFELTIRADAIQTENLGDGVDTAKEAFAAAKWGNYKNTAPVSAT